MRVFLFLSLTAVAFTQNQGFQKFDAKALFQPGMSTMQAARTACTKSVGPEYGACFVDQMKAAGASSEAVAFMHAIQNNGFMRDFTKAGKVDVAFAFFPFAANENEHCLLVNGTPNIIDVDDYSVIPRGDFPKNKEYEALRAKYPNITVFPGDRAGTKFIVAKNPPGGGQSFLVPYVLVDGCHACARVGKLELAFEFDGEGKFRGAKVTSVTSLSPPK